MAEVTLRIGGRPHMVVCRDGEEGELETLGRRLDAHAATAARAAGAQGGERTMLFIALMLADELGEAERARTPAPPPTPALDGAADRASAVALERVAEQLESLAERLEKAGDSA